MSWATTTYCIENGHIGVTLRGINPSSLSSYSELHFIYLRGHYNSIVACIFFTTSSCTRRTRQITHLLSRRVCAIIAGAFIGPSDSQSVYTKNEYRSFPFMQSTCNYGKTSSLACFCVYLFSRNYARALGCTKDEMDETIVMMTYLFLRKSKRR